MSLLHSLASSGLLAVQDKTFWMPKQASAQAADIDWLYYFIYYLTAFTFLGCLVAGVYLAWRYRRRPGHRAEPSPHHNTPLEVTWSAIPLVLVIFIFWWGFKGFMHMSVPPANAYKIEVSAGQWWWKFTYPNGAVASMTDGLHVPPNEPVMLIMESGDVLHSFFVPEFRVKRDVVPGRFSTLWFTATEPGGVHPVFCTEYCGTDHSAMTSNVYVHETRADFEAWVAKQRALGDSPWKLYQTNCASCHNYTDLDKPTAPGLGGLFGSQRELADGSKVEADEAYLRESIINPNAKYAAGYPNGGMATDWGQKLTPAQLDALIEFLKDPEAAKAAAEENQ